MAMPSSRLPPTRSNKARRGSGSIPPNAANGGAHWPPTGSRSAWRWPSRVQKRVGHCAIGRSLATAANARITATRVCSARAASPHCSSATTRARRSTPRRNADSAPAAVEETGAGTAVIGHSKGLPA
ncbi:hypothetical protein G6F65_017696 [Rhizopus arrhizus]|nr:hypothetical protein G6F65_017696 [Rhizopus arrhizus]